VKQLFFLPAWLTVCGAFVASCALTAPLLLAQQPPPTAEAPAPASVPAARPRATDAADLGSGGDSGGEPIDITSEGETTYESTPLGRVTTATGKVSIQTTDSSIYADHAEYNIDTREALLVGNVRIYRTDTLINCERAVYNFNTKAIRTLNYEGSRPPFQFGGLSAFSPGAGAQYNLRESSFTTHDSSKPDYVLKARRVRIYPDNRVIYIGTTLYIGKTPVFYFPYFYQSLDQQSGYTITPGYNSEYGAYLLLGLTFPITEKLTGLARLDYRSSRGVAGGINVEYNPRRRAKKTPDGSNLGAYASDDDPSQAAVVTPSSGTPGARSRDASDASASDDNTERNAGFRLSGPALSKQIRRHEGALLETYLALDDKPDLNRTSLDRLPVDPNRYRFSLKQTAFFTDDLFVKINVDKLSDRYLLQDFFQSEFTRNTNPDNTAALVYHQPGFVATLLARAQLNDFFDTTERLPELSLEIIRQPVLNTGLFYEGETNIGYLHRRYDEASPLATYSSYRFDSFHQLTLPKTYFGWLNIIPKLGVRGTYYTRSAPDDFSSFQLENLADDSTLRAQLALNPNNATETDLKNANAARAAISNFVPQGGLFRPVVNTGFEASFKLSRVYNEAQSRMLGLDRLQHVIQPYTDLSVIEDFGVGSRRLLAFDRRLPTTQLDPIDFPQFTSTDSIDESTRVRVGVRNRLQTKRDALTFNWMEVDTFFQVNVNSPVDRSPFSNLFNQITFRPLPWVNLTLDSQLPVLDHGGFTEINTSLNFQVTSNVELQIGHRYLDDNPFFQNSSLMQFGGYFRFNDNWAFSFAERYEFSDQVLEGQSYTLYRDLTSFIASVGLTVRDNRGVNDYGLLVNFTLKGVPKVSLPVGFDVQSLVNQSSE
jgi:LPS-assembly protein